eukprot:c24573_g1_i1 orf=542-1132(+)
MFSYAWAGFMAGCLHALTGLDHLAALAPLCMGCAKLESAAVGALWGCGHDAGHLLVGLAFLVLKDKLHIGLICTWAARIVAVALIAIGVLGVKKSQEVPVSILAGTKGSSTESKDGVNGRKNSCKIRTFASGLVYGLQPDAMLMILPALTLPSHLDGAAFLSMFLVDSHLSERENTECIAWQHIEREDCHLVDFHS